MIADTLTGINIKKWIGEFSRRGIKLELYMELLVVSIVVPHEYCWKKNMDL